MRDRRVAKWTRRTACCDASAVLKPFVLQFPAADLQSYADEFSYNRSPANAIAAGQAAAQAGRYTRDGVIAVVDWKSPRTKGRIPAADGEIQAATANALSADNEHTRMETLTALPGVGVPVASALLLFALGETYPILDVNALASLGHKRRGITRLSSGSATWRSSARSPSRTG